MGKIKVLIEEAKQANKAHLPTSEELSNLVMFLIIIGLASLISLSAYVSRLLTICLCMILIYHLAKIKKRLGDFGE